MFEDHSTPAIDWAGRWWRPEDPDDKVEGTIRVERNSAPILETRGWFSGLTADLTSHPKFRILLGITDNGKAVTLYECVRIKWGISAPGRDQYEIRANFMLVGVHFEADEPIEFSELYTGYESLGLWLGVSGIEISQLSIEGCDISIRRPPEIALGHDRTFEYSLWFGLEGPNLKNPTTEVTVAQKASLRLKSDKVSALECYLTRMSDFQNLLSLAGRTLACYTTVTGCLKAKPADRQVSVDIHFAPAYLPTERSVKSWVELLFRFDDLGTSPTQAFCSWLESADAMRAVHNLYFANLRRPQAFLESRFLNLAMTAEAYHRHRFPGLELPPEEHQGRVEDILKTCPDGFRGWLQQKLLYSNEISLKKRIVELVDLSAEAAGLYIDNPKSFAFEVADTRNQLVHSGAVRRQVLSPLNFRIGRLMEILLLHELGLEFPRIRELLERHRWRETGN